jgi:hypothetical protein
MTSNVTNYSQNIDTNFPIKGLDNPSQGFRDNFAQIRLALDTAASEISVVQTKFSTPTFTLQPPTGTLIGGVKAGDNVTIDNNGTISVAAPYTLPVATNSVIGGVKAGSNVTIDGTGAISVVAPYVLTTATASRLGGVKIGYGIQITTGTISLDSSIPLPYALPKASASTTGTVKIGDNINVTLDGTISVAAPYTLPVATNSVIGGVKAGANVNIAVDGTISVTNPYSLTTATRVNLGGVKIGTNINAAGDGTISVTTGAGYVLPMSSATVLGGVKIGDNIAIDTSGVISVAAPFVLPTAASTQLGGIKVGNNLAIDGSGFLRGEYVSASAITAGIVKVGTGINVTTGTISLNTGTLVALAVSAGTVPASGLTGTALPSGIISSSLTSVGPLGNLNVTGITTSGSLTISGTSNLQQITNVVQPFVGSTGIIVHDWSQGSFWHHNSPVSSFTANFTNVPTTNNRLNQVTLIIEQGLTPYSVSAVQIAGSAQTIKWTNGSQPSPVSGRTEYYVFDLLRVNNAWIVTGRLASYG